MLAIAAASAGYQPRRADQSALFEVVLDHHERFEGVFEERYAQRLGDLRGVVGKAFKSFLDCGILAHGFLRVVCKDCRDEVLVPWSCKTRQLCPSCGQRRSQEFSVFLNEVVLEPVPWRHLCLTIPKALRGLFLRERALLRDLSRCAWKSLQQGLCTALGQDRAVAGAVVAVSTSGDLVNPHPHLHCVVSHGAWLDEKFIEWPSRLTAERIEALFRRHVLRMLVRKERLAQETADRLLSWSPSGFSVFLGEPIPFEADASRQRLARYLVKPPVSLERLMYDAKTCRVHYTSHKRGESRSFAALDFLAELSVHIPDKGEKTCRYYGRCSSVSRGRRRAKEQVATETPAESDTVPDTPSRKAFRLTWAALLSRVWGVDVLKCPLCGGERRIVSAITNLVTVRRILQHLSLYQLPRPPDSHLCEDRDPLLRARHPLLHPEQPPAAQEGVDADEQPDLSVDLHDDLDPDTPWPLIDPPHQE